MTVTKYLDMLEKQNKCSYYKVLSGYLNIFPEEKYTGEKNYVSGAAVVHTLRRANALASMIHRGEDGLGVQKFLISYIQEVISVLAIEGVIPEVNFSVRVSIYDNSGVYGTSYEVNITGFCDENVVSLGESNCMSVMLSLLGLILTYKPLLEALELKFPENLEENTIIALGRVRRELAR